MPKSVAVNAILIDRVGDTRNVGLNHRLSILRYPTRTATSPISFYCLGMLPTELLVYAMGGLELGRVVSTFRADSDEQSIKSIADEIQCQIDRICAAGPVTRVYDITTPKGTYEWEREVFFVGTPRAKDRR